MKLPIYLDYHATTPVDPRVLDAMLPWFTDRFGNASSQSHGWGKDAAAAVEQAREQVAALVDCSPREVIFTSGATESDNLAIKGVAEAAGRGRIITTAIEHAAVLDSCRRLESNGYEIVILPVDRHGILGPDDLQRALADGAILVSIQLANNEIGVVQPLEELARLCRKQGVPLHTDAVQGAGRLPMQGCPADLISLTAHKVYGPKGAGALVVRNGLPVAAQLHGGGQEKGIRSGTLNVPGIVGLGAACALAVQSLSEEADRIGRLRDRLQHSLFSRLNDLLLNGHAVHRLPGNLNVAFCGVDGEALLSRLPELGLSPGAACHSGSHSISHVLAAIGRTRDEARASIRFGLGRWTTEEEIDFVASRVVEEVCQLRGDTPVSYRKTSPGAAGNHRSRVAEVTDPDRGDRVWIKIDIDPASERIADARRRVFGCEYTLRCADLAVERMRGQTLTDVMKITTDTLLEAIEIPPGREFCAELVAKAVWRAVRSEDTGLDH